MAFLCDDSDFLENSPIPRKKPSVWLWVIVAIAIVVCSDAGLFVLGVFSNAPVPTSVGEISDNSWEGVIASMYGDNYIENPEMLTLESYGSDETYLETFTIHDGDIVEDLTGGGVADVALISQEFFDPAVEFMASVADEPDIEARHDAQDAWLENIETTDFGQRLFFQWEGNMSMMFAPVKYARDNVVYFMESSDDDLNVTELAKDMLIMDLDTNRVLHYKSAAN